MSSSGALSSLGIGSSVLTYDVIESLREADESAILSPIDRRIETNTAKQSDLTLITNYTNMLKDSASALGSDLLYLNRTADTNGTSASIIASNGVTPQTIDLTVDRLASKDIQQSKGYSEQSSAVLAGSGVGDSKVTFEIDGESFEIDITTNMSLSQLADAINNASGGKIEARVMNVGGNDPYKLIVQSAETGETQNINLTSIDADGNDNTDALKGALGLEQISKAEDAIFTYNGISMQRSSNNIDDISVGLSFKLLDTGKTTFTISQDTTQLIDQLNNFVDAYNTLMQNVNASTSFNQDEGTAGTLQGVSQINSIKYTLNRMLNTIDSEGRSLNQYGISFNDDGQLILDESVLKQMLESDPAGLEAFFKGTTTAHPVNYTAKSGVESGALSLANGDFTINGTSIILDTKPAYTQESEIFNGEIDSSFLLNGVEIFLQTEPPVYSSNKEVQEGALVGQFSINGIDIALNTDDKSTAEDNALALVDAINLASTGTTASLDGNKLILTNAGGSYNDIAIAGDSELLAKLGLSEVTYTVQESNQKQLLTAINNESKNTGVTASLDSNGKLSLKSTSEQGIQIQSGSTGDDLSVFGFSAQSIAAPTAQENANALATQINRELSHEGINASVVEKFSITVKASDGSDYEITSAELQSLGISAKDFNSPSTQAGAELMINKINNTLSAKGLTASLSTDYRLSIESKLGAEIDIGGIDSSLEKFGVTKTTVLGNFETTNGFFANFNTTLDTFVNKTSGSLTLLAESYTNSNTRMTAERVKAVERLDVKYQAMMTQFAAYDGIIASLNNQFSTLQSMIEAQYND